MHAGPQRAIGLVADLDRLGETVVERRRLARFVAQRPVAFRGGPMALGGEVVGAQPLERAGLRVRDHVVEIARAQRVGVHALEALESDQRRAIDVAAGEIAARFEAIGVVGQVAAQCRHHLEHARHRLVLGLDRMGLGRATEGEEGGRAAEDGARPHAFFRVATTLSIFSVASTAAAS